jgi:hypothetical protein
MHDESLSQESATRETSAQAAFDILDQRLVRALDAAPEIEIPADFAARVASRLPARPRPVSIATTHYGDKAIFIGILVTLFALVALTLPTAGRATFGLVESFLLAQFLALAVWLSIRRHSLR